MENLSNVRSKKKLDKKYLTLVVI